MRSIFTAIVLSSLAGTAFADIAVPNQTESVAISGLNTPLRSAARTYQAYYDASQFVSVTSSTSLSGLQFRLALGENSGAGASWPSQDLTFSSYEIVLAKPSATVLAAGEFPSAATPFAANMDTPVVVSSGALVIPAGSFTNLGAGVNPWGPVFNFSVPYTINPGEGLVLQVRLTGYTPGTELQVFFASGDYVAGGADAVSSTAGNAATTPTGFTAPMFVNFVVPAPGAGALLGLGGLVAFRRRRN